MPSVTMRVSTRWRGRALRPGMVVQVLPVVADRWAAHGIAERVAPRSLPADFPGRDALVTAGITTLDLVPRTLPALVAIRGVGRVTAERILDALPR
jgi:hypothetical protein